MRQRVQVRGHEPGADATGPYWVFAVVRVLSGDFRYLHGRERVAPPGRSFAVFMPPWSIVRPAPCSCVASTTALAAPEPAFRGAPERPVAWRWRSRALPTTTGDVVAVVREGGPFVDISREVAPSPMARRVKALLDESYCRPATLAALARQARLSPSVMSRAFKRSYGMPPVEYRHRVRVMDAMFRLSAGGDITSVLQDVGFGDTSRFYSHFRSLLCAPPGTYATRRSRNAKT